MASGGTASLMCRIMHGQAADTPRTGNADPRGFREAGLRSAGANQNIGLQGACRKVVFALKTLAPDAGAGTPLFSGRDVLVLASRFFGAIRLTCASPLTPGASGCVSRPT